MRDSNSLVTARSATMKFLDADAKRPLAPVSASVDKGNMVVFGPQASYMEGTIFGQRIPMYRRQGVFCGAAVVTSGYEIDEDGEDR